MILKASQRGGGKQLARHLMRTDENEHVEIHELRGFVSDDLIGALTEAHAVSKGTRCKQFLFSVSLNPPQNERVSTETFESAIARIEERNGLKGQPRIIVFHEKQGRRHAHAVWSRIDAETMTARPLPYFKNKLRDLGRELYIEQGWKMPRGFMNSRESDPRNFTLAEWQQAKRMGSNARDLKELMQECWAVSDSRAAFTQALKARGIALAKGDRRGFVALTPQGEVLSVARYTGKKTKEINARLGKPDDLPDVQQARADLSRQLSGTFLRQTREAGSLRRAEMMTLEMRRAEMTQQHRQEREKLQARQQERWTQETRARAARFGSGFRGLWDRLTGRHAEICKENEREAYASLTRDRAQKDALIFAQMKDRQALQEQIRGVRERHAALLKELRIDRREVKEAFREQARAPEQPAQSRPERALASERQASKPRIPTPQDRLARMRQEQTQNQISRGRDRERDRDR